MRIYRFSPIRSERKLVKAVKYVAAKNSKLCKKTIGKKLAIKYLTIFSHYPDEYDGLLEILRKSGRLTRTNNGFRVVLRKPIENDGHSIWHLRIRKPDPYRMHAGCSDFVVENYKRFKKSYLKKTRKNLRLIKREKYEMIEFFDPDFDVLAYVVSDEFL